MRDIAGRQTTRAHAVPQAAPAAPKRVAKPGARTQKTTTRKGTAAPTLTPAKVRIALTALLERGEVVEGRGGKRTTQITPTEALALEHMIARLAPKTRVA